MFIFELHVLAVLRFFNVMSRDRGTDYCQLPTDSHGDRDYIWQQKQTHSNSPKRQNLVLVNAHMFKDVY